MGTVYRGEDRGGNDLAIKLLRSELATDPVVVARFIQERALLLKMHSPSIVRVLDLVVEGDNMAIVMERVDGGSLRQYLKRHNGRLPTPDAVGICINVLEGLSVAHAKGVVHRDIKPDNVLIDDRSRPLQAKITDFGISGLIDGSTHTRLTSLVGTPEYMAPELIESKPATPAVDVYSAGIVLYELIAGATPFAGGHVLAILKRHAEQEPARPVSVEEGLWRVLLAMLSKDPSSRPGAVECQRELEHLDLDDDAPTLIRGVPPRRLSVDARERTVKSSSARDTANVPEAHPSTLPQHHVDGDSETRIRPGASDSETPPMVSPPRRRSKSGVRFVVLALVGLGLALLIVLLVIPSPSSWSGPQQIDAHSPLSAVSCASPSFCVAADAEGNILSFDGSKWAAPDDVVSSSINAISCISPVFCVAVDGGGEILNSMDQDGRLRTSTLAILSLQFRVPMLAFAWPSARKVMLCRLTARSGKRSSSIQELH